MIDRFDPRDMPMYPRKFDPHEDLGVRYIKLGPFYDGNDVLPGWGTSPYLDWFLETFYIHYRGSVG